jgi:PAS domain S-box-containing protein
MTDTNGAAALPLGLSDRDALATLSRADVAIVLTDPSLPDNPVVYVNDAFEKITGYARSAALGRNCRFLQGERTDPDHVRALREGIAAGQEVAVDILNHRADGAPFRNRLLIAPVQGEGGRITHFLGIQKALSEEDARRARLQSVDEALREVQHRVKNHLAMIVGLIRIQARGQGDGGAASPYDMLARRVESLQLLYEELSHAGRGARGAGRIALGAYLGRICHAIAHLDGRAGIRVAVDMAPLQADVEQAARIGLLLSEIVTNALEHAFDGRDEGLLEVRLKDGDGRLRLTVADDGTGIAPGVAWPDMRSTGGRIVAGLVEGLGADLDVRTGAAGTRVTLDLPLAAAQS